MKRIVSAILMASMVFGLTACGGASGGGATTTSAAAAAATTVGTGETTVAEATTQAKTGIKIGWLQKNQQNAFEIVINKGGEAVLEKAKKDGVIEEYYLFDGNTDPSIQVSQANDLINLGVNAVIMQPAELDGSAPVVNICHEAGIPVVLVNSLTSNADDCEGISASNDVEAGEIMANFVVDKLGETGNYAHLQGIIGNTAAINRTTGIHNVMDKQSGWKLLEEQSAEWQGDKASKFAQDWCSMYGEELNAIICDNDDMATAARNAVIAAGREDVLCIGVDATDAALAMVKAGTLDATVRQDGTTQGATAAQMAIDLAQGKEIEREVTIPFTLVTSENVDEYYKK